MFKANKATKVKVVQQQYSSRAVAAIIINQLLQAGKSYASTIPQYQNKLTSQDAALVQEICFGVARVLPRLEMILTKLLTKPLVNKQAIVHSLLLVGLYQILYLRIPTYAAVDEVLNAADQLKVSNFKALLNGVLRNFLRQQDKILQEIDATAQFLHPEWIVNKLKYMYPAQWQDILQANNQKAKMWLRVNQQKISATDYLALLLSTGIQAQLSDLANAILLEKPVSIEKLPLFTEGAVSIQDVNAQYAAMLLAPENNDVILDACAAPGGKTNHILEIAPQSQVIAMDIEESRLQRVKDNLTRLGQQATVICADASKPNTSLVKDILFDKILIDAPCSGSGVIARHPDIKWLRREQDIQQLQKLQQQILNALWQKLKPNGIILYVTCSVFADENYRQIASFLKNHPDAKQLPIAIKNAIAVPYGMQLLPSIEYGSSGFYYAKVQKLN